MEFQLQKNTEVPNIDGYETGQIMIEGRAYTQPVLLHKTIEMLPENWQPEHLGWDDVQAACQAGAEIVVIGTGAKQRFLSPVLMAKLAQQGVGMECMATAAACRTIMLLQSEGRKVWAWLLV